MAVASAAPSDLLHAHGHSSVAAGLGHGNGNANAHLGITSGGRLAVPAHGVLGRIASAVAELESDDSGQASSAAVLALAQSISPSALAPGHLSRLFELNAAEQPVELPVTGVAPSRTTTGAAPGAGSPARSTTGATTGSLPAAGGTQAPLLPSVVIAPPSTLPAPATFVPAPSGGASVPYVAGLIAAAVALAAMIAIRFKRRSG